MRNIRSHSTFSMTIPIVSAFAPPLAIATKFSVLIDYTKRSGILPRNCAGIFPFLAVYWVCCSPKGGTKVLPQPFLAYNALI